MIPDVPLGVVAYIGKEKAGLNRQGEESQQIGFFSSKKPALGFDKMETTSFPLEHYLMGLCT
jgi:hypothetical protein